MLQPLDIISFKRPTVVWLKLKMPKSISKIISFTDPKMRVQMNMSRVQVQPKKSTQTVVGKK